jgi:Fe2+ transport system protein FeoA
MKPIPVSFLECLEAIYRLARDGAAVSLDSLGKRLRLPRPLVSERVLGLQGLGLVEAKPSDRVLLTPDGRRIAVGLVRKHRGALRAEAAVPLHRLKPGASGIISRIEKEEPELLKYLATLGLLPRTKVEVEEVAPFGGPILVRVGASRYALGRKVASKILVKET